LSRTLGADMAMYLLKPYVVRSRAGDHPEDPLHQSSRGRSASYAGRIVACARRSQFQLAFEHRFTKIRDAYYAMSLALGAQRRFVIGFLAFVLVSFALVPFLGRDFFPMSMPVRSHFTFVHRWVRASRNRGRVRSHRKCHPPRDSADQLDNVIDNIGLPLSSVNLVYSNTGTIGPQDGDIQIALKEGHEPTAEFVKKLREVLPKEFPGTSFVPAGGHDQPDPQLRCAGTAGRIDRRPQQREANEAYAIKIMRKPARPFRALPTCVAAEHQLPQLNVQRRSCARRCSSVSPRAMSPTAWSPRWPAAAGRTDVLAESEAMACRTPSWRHAAVQDGFDGRPGRGCRDVVRQQGAARCSAARQLHAHPALPW
jgi:hypothetical protein